VARERSELLHFEWLTQLSQWEAEQLMFIDESAANERTLDRKFGWSTVNTRARRIEPFQRTMKWSILPLYTCEGFIDWEIIQGSFDADLFVLFLEEHVIPHTTPYPGLRSVLIMDNCKIHHDQVQKASAYC
jgi:hypothetical protein